jgi:ribosomal protein S18 acetylase RimI-like enzyme
VGGGPAGGPVARTWWGDLPAGLRQARPDDYDVISAVVDRWWGRPILDSLPRLFLDHFFGSSLVAPSSVTPPSSMTPPSSTVPVPGTVPEPGTVPAAGEVPVPGEPLRGFLVGFASPSVPQVAYIHFVGISPSDRGSGLGRQLYETFFAAAAAAGRREVRAVTAPVNAPSIAFHRAMGFEVSDPVIGHGGPGHDLVMFRRPL